MERRNAKIVDLVALRVGTGDAKQDVTESPVDRVIRPDRHQFDRWIRAARSDQYHLREQPR